MGHTTNAKEEEINDVMMAIRTIDEIFLMWMNFRLFLRLSR